MLKKLYVHNYGCLQNFTLETNQLHSLFLLGKNGSGKTTIFNAIEIFQQIGNGETFVKNLIDEETFSFDRIDVPIHLELEVELHQKIYCYKLIFDLPERFEQLRVKSEYFYVNQTIVLSRELADISIGKATFSLDWHKIGLPNIQVRSDKDPISIFREWLKSIIILSPMPQQIQKTSRIADHVFIDRDASNLIDWIRYLLSHYPKVYSEMTMMLQTLMPDFKDFTLKEVGKTEKELWVEFQPMDKSIKLSESLLSDQGTFEVSFNRLSDGEKIFFLASAVLAAQKVLPSTLCLWDEPDNYVSLTEIEYFIALFRKGFEKQGSQLIMASHSERVVKKFSSNNIYLLSRESHLHPCRLQIADQLNYQEKSIVDAYYYGEIG